MDSLVASSRGRRLLFFVLYLSEGGPIGLLWWALPAHLRLLGLPLTSITLLTSLLVLPWTLKFLWAPLIDASRTHGIPLRKWIGVAQIAMAATLLPLLILDPREQLGAIFAMLLLHAIAASTQDAAIDAYAISTITPEERGSINAFMQAGMLLGRGVFGGSTLVVISLVGLSGAVLALVGVLLAISWGILRSSEALIEAKHSVGEELHETLRHAWRVLKDRGTRAGFVVAILAGAGFEGVGAVAGPYLVDRGYDAVVIGMFFAAGTIPTMLLGAFLGGRLADRYGRSITARSGVLLIAALILVLVIADPLTPQADAARLVILGMIYLAIGFLTVSSYALFMDLTQPRLGATQFSAFMGATNLCEAWSGFTAGRLATAFGYPVAFAVLGGASLLSLPAFRVVSEHLHGRTRTKSSAQEPG